MTNTTKPKFGDRTYPYLQAIPDLVKYNLITKSILSLLGFAFSRVMGLLIVSAGRVAITSGDIKFFYTTWQGLVLILILVPASIVYIIFDLNAMIILTGKLYKGERDAVIPSIKEAITSYSKFLTPYGLLVVLYFFLFAPLVGVGLSVTLTKNLYIPTFISSVIKDVPIYNLLYNIVLLALTFIGIVNIFVLHGILLDNLPAKESIMNSAELMKENWKDYFLQSFFFALRVIGVYLVLGVFVFIIPFIVSLYLRETTNLGRVPLIFVSLIFSTLMSFTGFVSLHFYIMKLTRLYYSYIAKEKKFYPIRSKRRHPMMWLAAIAFLGIIAGVSVIMDKFFEEIFPATTGVGIIAHRAGGVEGPENTIAGVEKAIELGAFGSEIDVQRTSDGYYVINHDATFERVAGARYQPSEMTLEEIKQLRVYGQEVPTIEEMLDASKGKIVLFVELKGATADVQMAEDVIKMIKERDMLDEAVVISLKYDLIDYIETNYPEVQTGYLTFASFGNTAALNCDYIALEEESATSSVVWAIHEQDKKVLVWTCNDRLSQRYFLQSNVDALITDQVVQANSIIEELESRDDLSLIIENLATPN